MRFAPIQQQPGTLTSVWLLALELKRTKHLHAIVVFVFAPVGNLPHVQLGVGHAGQQAVKVVATEVRVACSGEDLEDTVSDREQRDVEGASAQVVDGDSAGLFLVEAVGEAGGGGFVDDA